ncbi:hypothetical protein DNTS_012193 [Danionella cerebrum]|uniref:Uncharacterized protein n=1 Tax=Danionella cerebrum TaxID=2873325 RepID=A0A553QZ60_9TELE|nr:hypothetical protein DNTS_012193 [Danionella translucida]
MPDSRIINPKTVVKKPRHSSKEANLPAPTPAGRVRDTGTNRLKTGPRKHRSSSCPGGTREIEIKTKVKDRSNKTIRNKLDETPASEKPVKYAAKEQPMPCTHALYEIHSPRAFTVFAPNPKKREDIQQKAEAELAALEDLRLSRAMGYISISPGTVGGTVAKLMWLGQGFVLLTQT